MERRTWDPTASLVDRLDLMAGHRRGRRRRVVAFVLSEPAGAEPALAGRQEASRAVITITIVCITGYLGSAALGSATAVVTTSPKPPNLEIWSTVGAEEVELQIVVGEAGDWDADPAFPTGPVEVEITVRGTPGQLAYVVLVGDQHLETSKWVADTATVSEVDPRDFVHATRDGTRCVEGVITGTGWFTSARALKVGVRISEDGSGRAHVKYTDERRWWRASGGRSEVSLPVVSFADQSSCVIPPDAGADAWFVPARWTLVERAGQPNLAAGDLVVVYRVDDGQSELFKEKSAARWTLRSGSEGESGSLAPTYRLETVNTRSHATTSAFVAALMYGVALTGLFELVRAAGPGWRVPTGTLARSSVPPAVASTNRSTGAGSVSAVAPTRRERRRRVAGVLTLLALAALAKRPRSR